jgi:hypothetical protein
MSRAQFEDLIAYVNCAGPMYGVQEMAFILYAVTKMHRPRIVVELGTGTGCFSFMIGTAMVEVGHGTLLSYDNGSQWEATRKLSRMSTYSADSSANYWTFLGNLAERFGVKERVSFHEMTVPPFPLPKVPIDMLVVDYSSGFETMSLILSNYLTAMESFSSIFIDGGASSYSGYSFLEKMILDLNNGKLPGNLTRWLSDDAIRRLDKKARATNFRMVHFTRQRERQNSTSWIVLEPVDTVPYPLIPMRW